jgi:predicted GNAT superfamily acetyltransferase
MTDGINAGEESDRLLINWRLESPAAELAASSRVVEPPVDELIRDGAVIALSVGPAGEPVLAEAEVARVLLCQVPEDIVAIRRSDPSQGRAWRAAVRKIVGGAISAGYEVTGATRSGWYVLESRPN